MNEAVFRISVQEAVDLLRLIGLFKTHRLFKDIGSYKEETIEVSKTDDYLKIYDVIVNNKDYDIQLFDDSIFQLSNKDGKCRYAFMQCTREYITREEFMYETFGDGYEVEADLDAFYAMFEDEYEQRRDEQKINTNAVYFRYDTDELGYLPNVHSYAHLHVGLNNSIRIPCSRELTPFAFVLFAVKHVYSQYWKEAIIKERINENLYSFKKKCNPLEKEHWKEMEKRDLYID